MPKTDFSLTRINIHHRYSDVECPGTFRDMMNNADHCLDCGVLCCKCLLSEHDPDLCITCFEDESD